MVKQVIVVRTDLDMPLGRIPAQVAHASIAVLLGMGEWTDGDNFIINEVPDVVQYWMKESFTKVVLKVHSEQELENLQKQAEQAGLPNAMISDDIGKDFHKMALGIGPATSEELDPITGHLKLL